jgi:hypothetical protein
MTERAMQVLLFLAWPAIACLLMFCVALICAAAWLLIPFGTPTREGTTWSLKFPWSKS